MKKTLRILTSFIFLLMSLNSQAGFFSSDYLDFTAGCGVGAVGGYAVDSSGDNAMRNAAIGCLGAGLITLGIMSYAEDKYGEQFKEKIAFEEEKLKKNMQRKNQRHDQFDNPFIKRTKRVIPAQKLSTGDIILPRVEESIELKNVYDRIGK